VHLGRERRQPRLAGHAHRAPAAYWDNRHPDLDPAQIRRYYGKIRADMGATRLTREHPVPNKCGRSCRAGPRTVPARRPAAGVGLPVPAVRGRDRSAGRRWRPGAAPVLRVRRRHVPGLGERGAGLGRLHLPRPGPGQRGRLESSYDRSQEPVFDRIREGIAALQAGTGAKISALRKPVTVHAWGGARLGPDPEHGVVDHNGEVRVLNGSQPPPSFRRRVGGEAPV
jgi:hypothetical protein